MVAGIELLKKLIIIFTSLAAFFVYRGYIEHKSQKNWLNIRSCEEKGKKKYLFRKLQDDALAAGIELSDVAIIGIALGGILGGFAFLFAITGSLRLGILGMAVGLVVPRLWQARLIEGRRKAFEMQLEDALSRISSCLRAGMNTQQALNQTTMVLNEPAYGIFNTALAQIKTGITLSEAIREAARRVKSRDMEMIATSIVINEHTGGNLADVLDKLAEGIRDQRNYRNVISTATTEGAMTAGVLAAMPFFIVGIMRIMAPELMAPLFITSTGNIIFAVCILCTLNGVRIVRKIMQIDM